MTGEKIVEDEYQEDQCCHHTVTPVPPPTKVTLAVAEKYKQCVRKYGLGATVGKVEKALSTKEILGTSPSLYHPALINCDTKQKLINPVARRPPSTAVILTAVVLKSRPVSVPSNNLQNP
ncbi:hypothetical protein B0H14DRAFT_3538721 [Mycena olivaceomarginata]|nr:hypothetical protein B0H14DRAFT_3538721 [Mycena olivaceomarginata]